MLQMLRRAAAMRVICSAQIHTNQRCVRCALTFALALASAFAARWADRQRRRRRPDALACGSDWQRCSRYSTQLPACMSVQCSMWPFNSWPVQGIDGTPQARGLTPAGLQPVELGIQAQPSPEGYTQPPGGGGSGGEPGCLPVGLTGNTAGDTGYYSRVSKQYNSVVQQLVHTHLFSNAASTGTDHIKESDVQVVLHQHTSLALIQDHLFMQWSCACACASK